jgi:peptidyl-tRNA hydrolase, PTH1 family
MYKLVIGLGNPESYTNTRHNVAKQILNYLAASWHPIETGLVSDTNGITLYKPSGYMNLCGKPIKQTISKLNLSIDQIIILHDDVDTNLGKLKLKKEGSANGHNGVKSIIQYLGNNKFHRLRIGIGRPNKDDVTEYVLSSFNTQEKILIEETIYPECKKILGIK